MRPRFTIRSLLKFQLFCAFVLAILCWDRPQPPFQNAGSVLFAGGALFWTTLLVPYWLFAFFFTLEDRKQNRVRPVLALVPAGWYYVLSLASLSWPDKTDVTLKGWWCVKLVIVLGTLAVCWVMLLPRCRLWYVVVAPLGFAIISGTIWFCTF